jgi:hypothetical protein
LKKNFFHACHFYLSNKFPFLLICLFLSLFDVQTRTKHTDQIPPPLPRPYMCRERGERNPIVTCAIPHWTPPLWHASCLLTTAKPEIGRAHDTIVLFPVSFYSFFSLFFPHTHTQRHEKVLSLFLLDRFWFFCHFFEHFQTTEKTKKLFRKKMHRQKHIYCTLQQQQHHFPI